MKNDTFTVVHPNLATEQMSVRKADVENDLFRVAFDEACKDEPADAREELLAWDFFKYGWEAAVRLLNDDAERAAAQEAPTHPTQALSQQERMEGGGE